MGVSARVSSITLIMAAALAVTVSVGEGREHLVGGKADAWRVPSSEATSLNKWAEKNRFLLGDTLVWKYDSKKDSVLQVTREAYLACNTSNPIAEHKNDETKVVLDKPGPHFFISGVKQNCDQGEKLVVVVMSPRSRPSGAISPALAPSPVTGVEAPAVAPATGGAAAGIKGGFLVGVGVVLGLLMM